MDLEMFAGCAVQILIKRNIFRMRAPTGAGETGRRVPFLISCRRARKNAPDNGASMTFSRFHFLSGASRCFLLSSRDHVTSEFNNIFAVVNKTSISFQECSDLSITMIMGLYSCNIHKSDG